MKLNNGRFLVDTDNADCIFQSPMLKTHDGYSHETEVQYSLWRSKASGKHFITMAYTEYIACLWWRSRPTSGNTLIAVEGDGDFSTACWRSKVPVPAGLLQAI